MDVKIFGMNNCRMNVRMNGWMDGRLEDRAEFHKAFMDKPEQKKYFLNWFLKGFHENSCIE